VATVVGGTRFFLKNGKEANWDKVDDFIPGKGEPIVYNVDENHAYTRLKFGDGIHLPRDLPFTNGNIDGIDLDNIVAKRVEHKLIFGAGQNYQYDGSADVTVPVYTGNYT
jgi:hypothetical protein